MHRNEPTAGRRTLGRAIDVARGPELLASFLGLRAADLDAWMAGTHPIPTRVLLALIDIVSTSRLEPRALANLARKPDPGWTGPERRRA